MSGFELFFSLFGLILGLAIASLAASASDILRDEKRIKIGWLTPLLVVFLLIDLTSFWIASYRSLQDVRVGFPSMMWAVGMAVVYFFAAAVVFPKRLDAWNALDEYYMKHYRWVIGGVLVANVALQTLTGALSAEGVLASWWERLFRWQDVTYYSCLAVIMLVPQRLVHIAAYVILMLGYASIVALNPALR